MNLSVLFGGQNVLNSNNRKTSVHLQVERHQNLAHLEQPRHHSWVGSGLIPQPTVMQLCTSVLHRVWKLLQIIFNHVKHLIFCSADSCYISADMYIYDRLKSANRIGLHKLTLESLIQKEVSLQALYLALAQFLPDYLL